MIKKLYYFFCAFYLVVILLAIAFYKERCIFIDIAFHLFNIVKDGAFAIQNFRFGAALTQIYPLLLTKMKMPLDTIMMGYSIGFGIYYFLCYLACGFLFKNYKMGLVLLLSQLLFASHTFYWMQSELPQAISLCMVFFASLNGPVDKTKPLFQVWIFTCILVLAFFHPLLLFVFSFLIFFFLLQSNESLEQRKSLIAAGIFYLVILVIKKCFFGTAYDQHAMGNAAHSFKNIRHFFSIYATQFFLQNCIKIYYWIPVISIWIAVTYISQKKWKQLALFTGYMVGLLVLVNVSYPDNGTNAYYIENMYLPLGVFMAVPLLYDVLPTITPKYAAILLTAICITGTARIFATHTIYTARLNMERKILHQYQNEKTLMAAANVPADTMLTTWGTAFEFWLLSTTETNKTASIIIKESPDQLFWALGQPQTFFTNWELYKYDTLPKRYFKFEDTVAGYKLAQ
ncbi:hypothetical protein [Taibaiella soli]|uniref:Glycosyltransferase RgtA/B/C/D-like domain-containing protein n=1 Tax=Taibaiella soli TaxID=1649169 RepID=A0A2W2AAC3_9BACT|nr:hypothetical protein [Taibaiella soli]PZF72345.1 hypothetical protein DN068_13395 [Taibaiella soli]